MVHGEGDGFIGVAHRMELLVALFNAINDLYRFIFIRRLHFHGLEAPFQRAVFLDGFAVFTGSSRANALYLSAGKSGLQDIGGIKRAFRRASPNQRMQLINKDDAVLVLHQFLHDGLEALFKLSTIFGSGND